MRHCGGSRRFVRDLLRGEDVAGSREEVGIVEHDTLFKHGYSLLQSFLHVQGWGSAQSCLPVLALIRHRRHTSSLTSCLITASSMCSFAIVLPAPTPLPVWSSASSRPGAVMPRRPVSATTDLAWPAAVRRKLRTCTLLVAHHPATPHATPVVRAAPMKTPTVTAVP